MAVDVWAFAAAVALAAALGDCCFLLSGDFPPPEALFNETVLDLMRRHFLANLNLDGTGAVIASRGEVPALDDICGGGCPGGYRFHWMRDGALSMLTLHRFAASPLAGAALDAAAVAGIFHAYAGWVGRAQAALTLRGEDPAAQPKWNISTGEPYALGWCKPQSDGPGLEAQALVAYASTVSDQRELDHIWALVCFNLDWLAKPGSSKESTCDLWEETRSTDFFWNRVVSLSGLLAGAGLAQRLGDAGRAAAYQARAEALGNPVAEHLQAAGSSSCFITECPTREAGPDCRAQNKSVDGAVILALAHGWMQASGDWSPTSVIVAQTVESYNELFCSLYPVNQADTKAGVPGVLYGRYARDAYGGGNPWPLITAALAALLYRAARAVAAGPALLPSEVAAWRKTLNADDFNGSTSEFVVAGDSVLLRIWHHVRPDDRGELYEQLEKATGRPYNARGLTWSYAEFLNALVERGQAWPCRGPPARCGAPRTPAAAPGRAGAARARAGPPPPAAQGPPSREPGRAAGPRGRPGRAAPGRAGAAPVAAGAARGAGAPGGAATLLEEPRPRPRPARPEPAAPDPAPRPTTGHWVVFAGGLVLGMAFALGVGAALLPLGQLQGCEDCDKDAGSSDEGAWSRLRFG